MCNLGAGSQVAADDIGASSLATTRCSCLPESIVIFHPARELHQLDYHLMPDLWQYACKRLSSRLGMFDWDVVSITLPPRS